jgi:hypothetical protein
MANTGWIKLHRSILNWEWWDDEKSVKLFMWLMIHVNYETKKWQGLVLEPGEIVTSLDHLSEATKLTKREIRTRLDNFVKTGEIAKQTTNKFTRITLSNWSKFQGSDEDDENDLFKMTNKRHSNDIQMPLTKEIKNKRKKRTLTGADAPRENSSPEFNSIENMRTEQRIDSLTRWNKVLSIWKSTEADYILKASCEKYWMTYSKEFQQEMVQFLEGLGPKSIHLSGLWISAMMKNKFFHPGQIQIEIEKKVKPLTNNSPRHLKNDDKNF